MQKQAAKRDHWFENQKEFIEILFVCISISLFSQLDEIEHKKWARHKKIEGGKLKKKKTSNWFESVCSQLFFVCDVSLGFQLFHFFYGHRLREHTQTYRLPPSHHHHALIDHTHRTLEKRTISLNWIPMIILYSCRIPNFSCSVLLNFVFFSLPFDSLIAASYLLSFHSGVHSAAAIAVFFASSLFHFICSIAVSYCCRRRISFQHAHSFTLGENGSNVNVEKKKSEY